MLLNLAQIMEDLNNLLYSGDIPNMFTVDEKLEVIESMREREQQLLINDFSISDVLVGRIVFDILAAMMVVNWDGQLPYENALWAKVSRARHAAAAREVVAAEADEALDGGGRGHRVRGLLSPGAPPAGVLEADVPPRGQVVGSRAVLST